jgi:hypothetical protein
MNSDFIDQLNDIIKPDIKPDSTPDSTPVANVEEFKQKTILIVSTHINQSNGYSKVIYNIIKELSKSPWLKIIHFGTQKVVSGDIGRQYPATVKVIDGTSMEKTKQIGFAFLELPAVITSEKPDIVFIYNDISVVCNYVEEIRKIPRSFKIWAYLDITYTSPPQQMIDIKTMISLNYDPQSLVSLF